MSQIKLETEQLKFNIDSLSTREKQKRFSLRLKYFIHQDSKDYNNEEFGNHVNKFQSSYIKYLCERESTLARALNELTELSEHEYFSNDFFIWLMNRIREILDKYSMNQTKILHIEASFEIWEILGLGVEFQESSMWEANPEVMSDEDYWI
jgi:hypothetical protein